MSQLGAGRLSDRLKRFYDPRTMPAPLGRSRDGWPLIGCLGCERPIPWNQNPDGRCPISPKTYYVRQFCTRACQGNGHGEDPARTARLRGMIPSLLDPWVLPLPAVPEFARALPLMDEIRTCAHCHARGPFEVLEVGKSCFACGHLNFARDGAWQAERLRVR